VSDTGSSLPPPPPSASPPPGYVGYEPSLAAAVPLRRVNGLGKAILILLVVAAVGFILQAATSSNAVDKARDFLAGRIDEDQFTEDTAPYTLAGVLSGLATLAIVVLTMIWLFRIAANHRTIGRRLTWAPGWAIGGWFLPPFVLYVIPMLMLRESWKASDPEVPPEEDRWRTSAVSPLVYVWWVLYGLVPIIFLIATSNWRVGSSFGSDQEDVADFIEDQGAGWLTTQGLVGLAQVVAFGLLVRGLTARHRQLTGESTAR
jgi:Domain of unknown function (DUF4328)